jgi:hypothetical protein
MVLVANFQKQNSRNVYGYWCIISLNSRQRRKLFIPKSQYTAEGQKSVQRLRQKAEH